MSAERKLDLLLQPSSRNLEAHAAMTLEIPIATVRWLGIAVGMVAASLLYPNNRVMWAVILLAAAYNAFFQFFVIPYRPQWLLRGYLTSVGDVALSTAAVVATGGLRSEFYLVYFLIAVLAAVRFSQKAAVLATCACLVCYMGVAALSTGAGVQDLALVFLRVGFVLMTALFAGYVGDRTRRAQQSLAKELDEARQGLETATKAMSQPLDLSAVAAAASDSALALLQADIAVLRVEARGGSPALQLLATSPNGANISKLLDTSLLEQAYPNLQQPLVFDDETVRRHLGLDPDHIRLSYVVCCPLRLEKESLGVLTLIRLGPREPFSNLSHNLLSAFADRAAVSLARAQVYTQLEQMAYADAITGLPNHRAFQERLTTEWLRCSGPGLPLSLLMVDINGFKQLNDTLGHAYGDTMLKELGRLLQSALGPGELAARYGGDEFVVLLPGKDEQSSMEMARILVTRVREMERSARARGLAADISVSVGNASFPNDTTDRTTLLTLADLAMYMAKHLGKNHIYAARALGQSDPMGEILTPFVEKVASGSLLLGPGAVGDLERKLRLTAQLKRTAVGARPDHSPDQTSFETICALAAAVDAKDPYTENHSRNVANYARTLSCRLGLDEEFAEQLFWAALMLDIGKIGIPDAILSKPDPLTSNEMALMQQHPSIGARIISQVQSLQPLVPLIRHHHESYDGSGYPDGLTGEEIPLGARMLAVCDLFDAVTSDRPYRSALPLSQAFRLLRESRGRQLDPQLVDAFVQMIAETSGEEGRYADRTLG